MDKRQPRGQSGFDETDALIVFDDVFVPWERVFVFRDRRVARMNHL